jgi:TolB-like protein
MEDNSKSADIVETLDDILANKIFAASPKAQDFLRYIITEALEGRCEQLTGVTIAQDVFGKDADFDPMQDSVVRVTARRVRYMLQDYYAQGTSKPKVKISIPKGKYRPHFEYLETETPEDLTKAAPIAQATPDKVKEVKPTWLAIPLAILAFIITTAFFSAKSGENSQALNTDIASYPSIAVISFTNQTDNDSYEFLEQSLQKQMTEDLSRFTLIRPLSYDKAYETLLLESRDKFDYAITGVILGVEPEIDLYIKLIDLNNSDIIFEDRIRRAPGKTQYYDALFDMVSDLSGNFAGMEGVIVQKRLSTIQEKIATDTLALTKLNALECNSLIDKLLKKPSPALYKTIYGCLETLLEKDPNDDTLLASFGWITHVGATSHEPVLMARSINPDINADEGYAMIEKAVTLNPENDWAQQILSSMKLQDGDVKGALRHAEMAVVENPANPDNLISLSLSLANNGKWERSISLAQEAIDRNPEPPVSYYYPFFLKGLYNGDVEAMRKVATLYEENERYYAKLYSYLTAVAAEDLEGVQRLKPHIDDMADRNEGNLMTVIKSRMHSKSLQEKAKSLLDKGDLMLSNADG